MIDDFDLIVSSFQTQYGIRLSRDLDGMKWNEFKMLLTGIMPETPLGRVVSIRSEKDREVLKRFTKEQKRIRDEWRNKQAQTATKESVEDALESLKIAFMQMAGGGTH